MTNLNSLIEKEIFKSTKIKDKIYDLLSLFNNNKEILFEVQNYYDNVIETNKSFNKKHKEQISDLLKKSWLQCWLESDIEQRDIVVINKYLSSYTINQQEKINANIEQSLGSQYKLAVKQRDPLMKAIQSYRKGNVVELEDYVENCERLTKTELSKIAVEMRDSKRDNSVNLQIWNKAISKSPKTMLLDISVDKLLKEPPKDAIIYIEQMIKDCDDRWNETHQLKTQKNLAIKNLDDILSLRFSTKQDYIIDIAELLHIMSYDNPDHINNAIQNTEYILEKYSDYINEALVKKLKITEKGLAGFLQAIPLIQAEYKKFDSFMASYFRLPVEEFIDKLNNVVYVYNKNKLEDNLTEKSDYDYQKRMKI